MTGDKEDLADVFAIPNFWGTSTWLGQLPQDDPAPFFSSNLAVPDSLLEDRASPVQQPGPFRTPEDGFFKLPQLQQAEAQADQPVGHETNCTSEITSAGDGTEPEFDLWTGADEPTKKELPVLQTWESFIKGASQTSLPMLLTEAGSTAYDALLSWAVDPLELENKDVPVVDTKAYFASLLSLALGRESVLFLKNSDGISFKPALPKMRISGYTSDVLQGLEKQCLSCGDQLLELRSFVHKMYSKATISRCGVALASALKEVLEALQENTVVFHPDPRSLLRLQATIKGISAILGPFCGLTRKLKNHYSDEQLISLVFEHTCVAENMEEWVREMMQEVLRRVSHPWIESLEQWLGTRAEEGISLSKSNVGQSRGFVKVEVEVYTDDFGDEVEEVDFRLDRQKIPSFMPEDIIQTAFETGRNLRFLRDVHPDHPLVRADVSAARKPPTAGWLYDWDAILKLEGQVTAYRDELIESLLQCQLNTNVSSSVNVERPALMGGIRTDIFSLGEDGMREHIEASINQLNAPIVVPRDDWSLRSIIHARLENDRRPRSSHPEARPHWSLLPVLSFGSIISAQAHVVNRETLRQLFKHHRLRAHLDLQRNFHLHGNGMFSSRLSHALFDPELERADRQAGVARQGGVMGLRLEGRDSWPPASSELRLALMGILVESYHSQIGHVSDTLDAPKDASDLPGDLSFAVRDLSEEEIEKCMDPNSLEALDFLRLSYKSPPALTSVMTPIILMQYDRIFKLLLRVLRLSYVTNQLWHDITRRAQDAEHISYRFARETRHFVSSIASFFLDTGIAVPWKVFEGKLDRMQESLENRIPEQLESPEQLRELHSGCLNAIMLALFLRKRQLPVLKLLEEVFTIILQYAKLLRAHEVYTGGLEVKESTKLYSQFKKKVQIFITVCKGLTEKSRSKSKADENRGGLSDGLGDESMVAQLLLRLDIAEYYSR